MFSFFGKLSKEQFAALVLKRIKKGGGPSDFIYDPKYFSIKREKGQGFLGNCYDAYVLAKGAQRETILSNFVATMIAQNSNTERSFDEVRDQLVTVVRERALFAFTSLYWQLGAMEKPVSQQTERLSDWFAKAVVIDAPSHMSLVNEDQVMQWGYSSDEVFTVGFENLKNATTPRFSEDRGVFKGMWNDDYDSSRILLPGLFDDLPLKGEPVVTIPNRLTLLVAGSEDHDAIVRMLETAEEIIRTQAKAQNPAPLLIRNGAMEDFSVEPASPVFNQVERAKRIAALLYYQEQKQALEKLYEKNGKDFFVASYTLNKTENGKHWSYTVWSRDVPSLLPVVDEIIFYDPSRPEEERTVGRVSWERAFAVLGDYFLDTQMFPARYFVSKFPSEEELALIRKE